MRSVPMRKTISILATLIFVLSTQASNAPAPGAYLGCSDGGDGGDITLNKLKNRSMMAENPRATALAQILHLPSSSQVGRNNPRSVWTPENAQLVAPFEAQAVSVEGFLRRVKQEGLEHCNCERQDLNDFHMWIIENENDPPAQSIVVELTPRWRGANPNWTLNVLNHLVAQHARVRITGWMMFDQEHPEQLHAASNHPIIRGTLWEVHPVTKIEVLSAGQWREI